MADDPADARPVPGSALGRGGRRMAWAVAISIALHLMAALPMARWTAEEKLAATPAEPPDDAQPAVMEVLLSDPTLGAAPEDERPVDPSPADTTQTETQANADTQPPETPAPQTPPTETTEATPAPTEPQPETADEALPLPPPPPPAAPAAPALAAAPTPPPIRLRPGASPDGRDEGRTEIVVGDNVVPASADPGRANIPPRYPAEAARRGQQGEVVLSLVIGTDGSVLVAEVARSSGFPALDRAAREAASKWHFRPAMRGGIPIPTTVPYTMVFQLGG